MRRGEEEATEKIIEVYNSWGYSKPMRDEFEGVEWKRKKKCQHLKEIKTQLKTVIPNN
jgi:hypothetical protein